MVAQLVLFDFDGVISDSASLAAQGVNALRQKYGLPYMTPEKIDELYDTQLCYSLRKYGLNEEETKNFFSEHAMFMEQNAHKVKTFPEIMNLITTLNAKKALITSSREGALRTILGSSVDECFDYVVTKECPGNKTQKIQQVMTMFGVGKEETIYVGDTVSDVIYSQQAGIKIISVSYGYNTASRLEKINPGRVVNTIEELSEVLTNETTNSNRLYQ